MDSAEARAWSRGMVHDMSDGVADEVLPAERVDELNHVQPSTCLEPEPELELELTDLVSTLPGALNPVEVADLSVKAQRAAAPAKAKVAARHGVAQLVAEQRDIDEQLAERRVFSGVRYAEKVAHKRRARNLSDGSFMRDARRNSFRVTSMHSAQADARAALTGHHSTAQVAAASLLGHAAGEAKRTDRKMQLHRNASTKLYSGKVAQKRAASGMDEGAFARKAQLTQLVDDCPVPAHMSEEDLRHELYLRTIACSHMSMERLVAEVAKAREGAYDDIGYRPSGLATATCRKLQYGLPKDIITSPVEPDASSIPRDRFRMDVPAEGGMLAGTALPRESISCDKLDRRKDRGKYVAVDEIVASIPQKRRAEVLLSLLPDGCWFPESGEPVKLFVDISQMIRPRDKAERLAGCGAIVCALRKSDRQEKWCTLDQTEKLTISPTGVARLELRHFCDVLLVVVHAHETQACARMLARVVCSSRRIQHQLLVGAEAHARGLVGILAEPSDGSPPEKGYEISGVAVARFSTAKQGQLRVSNDVQETERVARAIADEKRFLKQPTLKRNMNRRRCCSWLHHIDFVSAPPDRVAIPHRVPTRTVHYTLAGNDADSDDDTDFAGRDNINLRGEKQKLHRLVKQISNGEHVMDIIIAGFVVISAATVFAAFAATHLTRVAIALLTIVPGSFLLFVVKQCTVKYCRSVVDHSITDDESLRRFWPAVYAVWAYSSIFLTLFPMVLMAPEIDLQRASNGTVDEHVVLLDDQALWGTMGFLSYGAAQWGLGWIFLWWHWEFTAVLTVRRSQRSQLPHGPSPTLKLLSTLYESYTYSGFSFFMAVPWEIIQLPVGPTGYTAPPLHRLMQFGIFEFEGAASFSLFVGACVTVCCSFLLLVATVHRPTQHSIVVQFFFDLLSFPMIKQLTSVFACTSAAMVVRGEQYCKLEPHLMNVTGAQCMDTNPTVMCWGGVGHPGRRGHSLYVLAVMALLIPYYWLSLKTLLAASARTSVVAKDARWSIIAFQSKVLLAFLSTVFGDCHPKTILSAVGTVVGLQLCYAHLTGQDKLDRINAMANDEEQLRALIDLLENVTKQKQSQWPREWEHTIAQIRNRQDAATTSLSSNDSLEVKRHKIAELQALLKSHGEQGVDESLMQTDHLPDAIVETTLQTLTLKTDVSRLKDIASQVSYPTPYSSVPAINCVHYVGLWLAAFNCAFGVAVMIYSDNDKQCFVTGTVESVSSNATLPSNVYWAWMCSNLGIVLCGYMWFRRASQTWRIGVKFTSLDAINKQPFNFQVDYSILQSRVNSAERLLKDSRHDTKSTGREIVIECLDPDIRLEFYEPSSPFGHVLKSYSQGSLANCIRTLTPGQRLISVQGVRVTSHSLDAVKQHLTAVAKVGPIKLTFSQPVYFRVLSTCLVYETIEEYTGQESGQLKLRATKHHLGLQQQVCATGRHEGKSSFIEVHNGVTNEEPTDGQAYIRISHRAGTLQPGKSHWVRQQNDFGVDILRKERADFAIEVHLYEDSDYVSTSTAADTDYHQQLEKPSLEYAINSGIPLSIHSLDISNELKTNAFTNNAVRESMLHWHDNLTNAPSGRVLIESLLHRHKVAEMQQRRSRCHCRRKSGRVTGLTHEYELQAACCVCNYRCCRVESEAPLTAKIWRCFTGWFDKMVFCQCMRYRTRCAKTVRQAVKNQQPRCYAVPIVCIRTLFGLHKAIPEGKSNAIKAIHLRGHGIHGPAITAILSRHINCRVIDLADCSIGTIRGDIEALETVLSERAEAWTRDVGETVNVFEKLMDAGAIHTLNLSNNELGDIGGVRLVWSVRDLPIAKLDISHCKLAHESIFELALLLENNTRAFSANLKKLKASVALSKYCVRVVTSPGFGAGTDANVAMKLIGSVDSKAVNSDWIPLDRDHQERKAATKNAKLFQHGQEDEFSIYCDSVGHVQQICIRHDDEGLGSDWKLDRVEVWEPGLARHKAVFDCHSWLRVAPGYMCDDDGGSVPDCVEASLRQTPPIDYDKNNDEKIAPYWKWGISAPARKRWGPQPSRWQRLNEFDWWQHLKRLILVQDRDARDTMLGDQEYVEVHQAQSLLLRYETDLADGSRSDVCRADDAFDRIAKLHGCEDKIKKAKRKMGVDASKYIDHIVNKWKTRVCEVGMIDTYFANNSHVDEQSSARLRRYHSDDERVYELCSRDPYRVANRDFTRVRMGPPDVVLLSCWLSLKHVELNGLTIRSTGLATRASIASDSENHFEYCLTNREVWNTAANQRGSGFDLSHKHLGPADVLLVSRFIEKHIPEERVIDTSVDAEFNLNLAGCPIVGASVDLDLRGINHLCHTLKRVKPAELNLSQCGIGPASVAALAHMVKRIHSCSVSQEPNLYETQSLRKLVLSGNNVTGGKPVDSQAGTSVSDWFRPIVYDCVHSAFSEVHQVYRDNTEAADWGPWHDLCLAVHDSKVQELSVADAGLGPLGCKTFAQSVNRCTTVIDLSSNLITGSIQSVANDSEVQYDVDVSGLEELQRKVQEYEDPEHGLNLTTMRFSNCLLGWTATKIIAQIVDIQNSGSMSLTCLDLSGCRISRDGNLSGYNSPAEELARAIGDSITLSKLRVDSTGVPGCPRTYSLCAAEASIDVSYSNLGEADLHLIVAWLNGPGSHTKAKWASIAGNAISESEREETQREKFQQLVKTCPKLNELRIREAQTCAPSNRPGVHMSAWRAVEFKLVQLDLLGGRLRIEREDIAHLERLDLSSCYFMPQGVGRLATVLGDMRRLQDLSLRGSTLVYASEDTGTDIQKDDAMSGWIALCQTVGTRLRRWDLSSCGLNASAIHVFSEQVPWDSARLSNLNLNDNPISTGRGGDSTDFTGLRALLKALGDLHDTTQIREFELVVGNSFQVQVGRDLELARSRFEMRHPPGFLKIGRYDDPADFFEVELREPPPAVEYF